MAREQGGLQKKTVRPWATIGLALGLAAVTVAVVTWRSWEKARLEAIDALLTQSRSAFDRDTAEGYALAAASLEKILAEHDPSHPEALGRLTHALAILWAEHGEEDRLARLGEVAARAKEEALGEAETWAGVGLQALEGAPDRVEGAAAARAAMEPFASRFGDGTAVDLVLGQAELAEGEYEAAFASMERVQRSGRMPTRTSVLMAIAARKAGRFQTAKSLLDDALRITPDHPRALATLASLELRQNRVEAAKKALEQFEKAARRTEVSARTRAAARYARSEYFYRTGQEARAEGLYREAVELDPRNADFPHGLGRWHLLVGRPEEALEPLERAVTLEPGRYAFLVDLAEAEMNLRRFEKANAHIDRALQLEPDYLPALLAKGRAMRRTGQPGTAAYLRQLLDERPGAKVEIKLELGRWFRSRERYEEGQAELEEAIASMGGRSKMLQAEVVLSYGRLMEDMGRLETAKESYARAAEFGDPEGWYRLSAAAFRSSQPELAKEACTRYLEAGQGLRYARNAQAICDRL
jgi:tetratricopeptide (TPR) repeat protein